MFKFDMHILKTHTLTHVHYRREIYTTGIRKKREEITEDKCQRRHMKYH